jgi:hypothetical protein
LYEEKWKETRILSKFVSPTIELSHNCPMLGEKFMSRSTNGHKPHKFQYCMFTRCKRLLLFEACHASKFGPSIPTKVSNSVWTTVSCLVMLDWLSHRTPSLPVAYHHSSLTR